MGFRTFWESYKRQVRENWQRMLRESEEKPKPIRGPFPDEIEYAREFHRLLAERRPDWLSYVQLPTHLGEGRFELRFPCPNPAVADPLVLEVENCEATVYWPACHDCHFDNPLDGGFDEAVEHVEEILTEQVVVCIQRNPKTGKWEGSSTPSVERRFDDIWRRPYEIRSWKGTYDGSSD